MDSTFKFRRQIGNALRCPRRTLDPVDLAAERRTKAAYPWRWQPGQTGNPGGLSKFYWETRRLARDAAPAVMARLIELALHADDERVASLCGVAVLDRAGIRLTDYNCCYAPTSWSPSLAYRSFGARHRPACGSLPAVCR